MRRRLVPLLLLTAAVFACQMAQRIRNLQQVDFTLDRIEGLRVAGMDLSRLRSFNQLSPRQLATITAGALAGEVPLEFDLIVSAHNPKINQATAELFQMDWSLLLGQRETVTGRVDRRFQIRPGERVDVPVRARLDLAKVFGRDGEVLLDVLRSAIGEGGRPIDVTLRAVPYVGTPFGPIRYPQPIDIVRRVGG